MPDIDITEINKLRANWNYPTSVRFGVGRIKELVGLCQELDIKRPLLVTDQGLKDLDFIQAILSNNAEQGLTTKLFSHVKPNPTGQNIDEGVAVYKQGKHDGVIAVGGGSALDAAKAIALMIDQDYPLWAFEDIGDNWRRVKPDGMAPLIAVPTTAGTGSEVGRASVILDESTSTKKIIFHPDMMPDVVLEDPELTRSLPAHITAATGIDAFVHNLEAYCTPAYHPMADGIALEGMRLIKQWLPQAFSHPTDLVARSHMLIASSMGATAFQKGLGGIHALAHPLGALFDKHHGLLNAVLMPYVLMENKSAIEAKLKHIAHYLELGDSSFNGFMDWILDFRQQLAIPNTLGAMDIDDKQAQRIGQLAVKDPSAGGNPIQFSAQQYSALFTRAVHGEI